MSSMFILIYSTKFLDQIFAYRYLLQSYKFYIWCLKPSYFLFPGLLFFPSKLGFEKVHDWMVLIPFLAITFLLSKMSSSISNIVNIYNCSVVLFPVAVTFFVTWWFIQFVDGFFSPIYDQLGIDIFGKSPHLTFRL